ncbi:hypothetical protein WG66_001738 [Moniliophthora roreri]|uniref:Uncharacterized protein n=1 Tax=Moniliophthora roreri TaxID=221103 RepID=A0A0W0GEE8_MONRR|nr:hypothetical protein WG66_001738 [Moniliophthora roreri]
MQANLMNALLRRDPLGVCNCSCGFLEPDPDIAGTGVITAFLCNTALAWVCGVVAIASWYGTTSNKFDQLCKKLATRLWRKVADFCSKEPATVEKTSTAPTPPLSKRHFWEPVIYPLLLSLHDTQLISGNGILIAAIIRHKTISVYHFTIAADLAWIASGTQLLTFISIRPWIRNRQLSSKHSRAYGPVQILRLSVMVLQLGLLLYAAVIQGDQYWDDSYTCPLTCFEQEQERQLGGIPEKWMVINIVLPIWSYGAAILRSFSLLWNLWVFWRDELKSRISDGPVRRIVGFIWSFLDSAALELASETTWFALGIHWIKEDRRWAKRYFGGVYDCPEVSNTEEDWGFGQILPMLLVLIPIIAGLQSYGDEKTQQGTDIRPDSANKSAMTTPMNIPQRCKLVELC